MKYAAIKNCDIANGTGIRVSLFVSGCTHFCEGCFNEIAWDFNYGNPFTFEVEEQLLEMLSNDYVQGLSLLGGEPFEVLNQQGLLPFVRKFKERFPSKNIWCYTGYDFEKDILDPSSKIRCKETMELLSYIDVLVDGKFVLALKDISLKFRGSSNQRIIDVKRSLSEKTTIIIDELM